MNFLGLGFWVFLSVFVGLFICVMLRISVFCVRCISTSLLFGCQYQCNQLPGKTRLQNDLLCVEWDIKPYTFTDMSSMCYVVNQWRRDSWQRSYVVSAKLTEHTECVLLVFVVLQDVQAFMDPFIRQGQLVLTAALWCIPLVSWESWGHISTQLHCGDGDMYPPQPHGITGHIVTPSIMVVAKGPVLYR